MDREIYDAYYANLSLAPGQIRLVGVYAAKTWDDPVICHIGVVDVFDSPPYNAVSYTWGGQRTNHTVSCSGHDIPVTQSCVDALKGIRFQDLPVVWIDQLSINQFDPEERNQQVLFMHEIYSKAKTIYISLGDWESRLAEESNFWKEDTEVNAEGKVRQSFAYPVPQGNGETKDLTISGPTSAVHASFAVANELLKELAAYIFSETHWDRLKALGSIPTAWKIIADILSNPYWRRKWIVQEIALGSSIQVMISQFTVRWEDVLGAFIVVNRMVHPAASVEEDEQRFKLQAQPYLGLLKDMAKQQTSSLLTIGQAIMALQARDLSQILLRLARPGTLETTWDIDSVYAVRALMKGFGDIPPPRYGQKSSEAYLQFSRWFIENGYGAEILIARTYDGISLAQQERPTWNINWSSQHMTITKETIIYNHSYFHGQRNPSTEFTRMDDMVNASRAITLLPDSDKLKVVGSVIDAVASSLPQPEGCTSSITFEQARDFVAEARSRRSDDARSWVTDYLASSERHEQKHCFMKDHRASIEGLEEVADSADEERPAQAVEFATRKSFDLEDSMLHHFTMFITEQGWSGMGPDHMKEEDILVTINGLPTVFVLRREEDTPGEYILIGQAEVIGHAGDHGLALAMSRENQEFVIG